MQKAFLFCFLCLRAFAVEPCSIQVVEKGNGWPVPLVELRTVNQIRFVSDNNGLIALDAPELMGREVWFDVSSPGYEFPKDGFGYHGVRLKPEPGKALRVEVTRTSIAKRLGRVTGSGIFSESQKLGVWRVRTRQRSELDLPRKNVLGLGRHAGFALSARHF
jgi:hypothetical protein